MDRIAEEEGRKNRGKEQISGGVTIIGKRSEQVKNRRMKALSTGAGDLKRGKTFPKGKKKTEQKKKIKKCTISGGFSEREIRLFLTGV